MSNSSDTVGSRLRPDYLKREDLIARAEEKFGKQRAEELRVEIEQLAAEIEKLHAIPLEVDDEP